MSLLFGQRFGRANVVELRQISTGADRLADEMAFKGGGRRGADEPSGRFDFFDLRRLRAVGDACRLGCDADFLSPRSRGIGPATGAPLDRSIVKTPATRKFPS